MKKAEGLDSFSLEELKRIKKIISSYEDIGDFRKDLSFFIQEEEQKRNNINESFDLALMERLHVVDPFQLKVLKNNSILNLQALIDCDLDSLVGITPSMKRELEWIRSFYDMRSMVEKPNQKKKGTK